MKPPESIVTDRLLLRAPVMKDAEDIFQTYAQDPEITRYLIWRPHTRIEQTQEFVAGCIQAWQEEKRFPYVITESNDDHAIGMIELRLENLKADVGYVLGREYWGKGYVTEALRAVVNWCLSQPEIYRVWAVCDVDNIVSARVMEKVGMRCESILRRGVLHPNISDEPRDCYLYSITK
jgi:[ribosomal protein S5]-alanine N-acetyltransferase